MSNRYGSNLSFNDVLFNALLGFVVLFVLALLLINPITKKADIPSKAEFMITLEWDDEVADDIDIWVLGPSGMPISFQNKHGGWMHLDRDDLGRSTDIMMIDGEKVIIKMNREVVTMRGINPGKYYINVHVYNKNRITAPTKYTISVIDINPYREIYVMQGQLENRGDIHRLPGFTVNEKGEVTDVWTSDKIIVGARNRSQTMDNATGFQQEQTEGNAIELRTTQADSELRNSIGEDQE